MELILDTDFVIALERERKKMEVGPAKHFLERHRQDRFFITFTVAGELACGRSVAAKRQWQRLCRPFPSCLGILKSRGSTETSTGNLRLKEN